MTNNPYQKYKNAQYETASPEQLLLMLYNGAIKFGRQAKEALENGDIQLSNNRLKRVQAIISELIVTLDMEKGGEIAENLYSLYEYMNRRLIQANIRKDSEIVEEVLGLLQDLKEGWEDAIKQLKPGQMRRNGNLSIHR
ncbi:flagellar export chaperone FliS [Orenia metallireducens]|jgi:flagellar protein FliS|uniref:Flagellar secretion chaperone FliS n=1 Tax=Orenia metallireducens TaxID=1413210 RepID=A0A1C0AB85_9FIRM|nr:flagellar export chaperone FliS [Orenia metallireducens]OCL27608.1 flagellar export chaperone FliS [Orenia metallireducens]